MGQTRCILQDERLELDNNRAECSIKPFVTGQKNWLLSNTPRGVVGSNTNYSLIETVLKKNRNVTYEDLYKAEWQ
jgi:hypothetical protein